MSARSSATILACLVLLTSCRGDDSQKETGDVETGTVDTGDSATDTQVEAVDADGDGFSSDTDCDDDNAEVNPGAMERCDGLDNDCDGLVDDDDDPVAGRAAWYQDLDGDGHGNPAVEEASCEAPAGYVADNEDCDDLDPAIHPGAEEEDCADPTDYNCDGSVGYVDEDGDGFSACEECDDTVTSTHPLAFEICDGSDNDCDGTVDEDDAVDVQVWYADADADGYGDASDTKEACTAPAGYVDNDTDCDDTAAAVNEAAPEVCDSIDNDCDGWVDDADPDVTGTTPWYGDSDGDGYGGQQYQQSACTMPPGFVASSDDCDDLDAASYPGAIEVCDASDNDCDGDIDEGVQITWYADVDGDGYGDPASSTSGCTQPPGYQSNGDDCDDNDASSRPGGVEVCDGADNDCDGSVDDSAIDPSTWYADTDGDGYGDATSSTESCNQPSNTVSDATDCDDTLSLANPGAQETCDGVDNNCDGVVDEDSAVDASTWYADTDADGYGDIATSTLACTAPSGHVSDATDCDDGADFSYPGATELCDASDNNCDGTADNQEALGAGQACPATDCADIRDNNPTSADGLWWVDPASDGAFEVWCDQTTDGGGWNIVWKNHGGANGGEKSNETLFADAVASLGDAAVTDHEDDLVSGISQRAYEVWWASPNREWLKNTTLWDSSDVIENQQHIRVNMNSVTMEEIFSVPVGSCNTASDTMEVTVNDSISFASTNLINHYWSGTFGLANNGHGTSDSCGETTSNLIDDPSALGDTLYRLDDTTASLNGIRHLFSYVHTSTGRDASRCLYACWDSGSYNGHYDGFSWGVR